MQFFIRFVSMSCISCTIRAYLLIYICIFLHCLLESSGVTQNYRICIICLMCAYSFFIEYSIIHTTLKLRLMLLTGQHFYDQLNDVNFKHSKSASIKHSHKINKKEAG